MSYETHKEKLETTLTDVISELSEIAIQNKQTGDWAAIPDPETIGNADENVEADAVETWNERRALMAQLEIRYRNITRALTKLEQGTYGVCEICGGHIEPERLQANPAARTDMAHMDREKELIV